MLDPKEEKRFADLRSLCLELKVPAPPEIIIGLQVHDKDGVLIFDDIQRGHSWTRSYWNSLMVMFGAAPAAGAVWGPGYLTFSYNLAGVLDNRWACNLSGQVGTAGVTYPGIVIGTSSTAENPDSYNLGGLLVHGTGSGQMSHQAGTPSTAIYDSGTRIWTASSKRIFNNNSGASITVAETGWIVTPIGGVYHLNERSVLNPTVPVPNGAQFTVTYNISMDFSAIDQG